METKTYNFDGAFNLILDEIRRVKSSITMQKSFHDTRYADALFKRQIPAIITALERIADGIEEQNRILSKTDSNEAVKYIELYIGTNYSICLKAHRIPTKQELYTYLKTHENSAKSLDFSVEDIHDVAEITEDDANASYNMEYTDTLPYVN